MRTYHPVQGRLAADAATTKQNVMPSQAGLRLYTIKLHCHQFREQFSHDNRMKGNMIISHVSPLK